MLLSINHSIGNFVNNALLYLKNKSITEQSTKELEATTAGLNLSLIENIEQDTAITEEPNVNNSDIQRDLKAELLKVVQYSSHSETSYAKFIEKFLDNPKFSNVLTKKVDHQDLSEIETILLNSIMKHLELLSSFESFGNRFYTFLADPRNEQYFPEIEDFDTEQEYLQCVQGVLKEQEEYATKFESQHQEYETLIAASLAKIEQQLKFSIFTEERVIESLEEMRLLEGILDDIDDLTVEQKDYVAYRVEAIINAGERVSSRAETDDGFLKHFKHQVLTALNVPLIRIALTEYIAAYEIKFAERNSKNIEYRLAFENSKLIEKFKHFNKVHQSMLEEHSVQIAEMKTFLKEYHNVIAYEDHLDKKLDYLFYFSNLSFSEYVECCCGCCCNCVNGEASTRFEEEQKETKKEIKIQMQKYRKAKQHLSQVEKQFEALVKQLSESDQEAKNIKLAS